MKKQRTLLEVCDALRVLGFKYLTLDLSIGGYKAFKTWRTKPVKVDFWEAPTEPGIRLYINITDWDESSLTENSLIEVKHGNTI